jgi:hypothetical protein
LCIGQKSGAEEKGMYIKVRFIICCWL